MYEYNYSIPFSLFIVTVTLQAEQSLHVPRYQGEVLWMFFMDISFCFISLSEKV